MQSILIVSKDKKLSEDHALKICEDLKISNFDITVIEKKPKEESKSNLIGIANIRAFQSKIFLKPLRSKNKAVILKNSQDITTEAQNALLKILEEPPPNTIIILTTVNKETLLPTILSRCKIIEFLEKNDSLPGKEFSQYLTSLTSLKINEKLKLAQDFGKTREEALSFLEKMILTARQELINKIKDYDFSTFLAKRDLASLDNLKDISISLNKAYTIIRTTNVSPRMALENLLL